MVQKILAPLGKLFTPPDVPSWLRACSQSEQRSIEKVTDLRCLKARELRGSAGSQPVSIVVYSVLQGAEHGRESVNPAKMKLCPSFQTLSHPSDHCCSVAIHSFVPRSQISNFCKNQPLEEPHALLCTSFTSCPEAFHDGEEILQGAGLLHMMVIALLRPVAQLYGQVRTDWNQCFVKDC